MGMLNTLQESPAAAVLRRGLRPDTLQEVRHPLRQLQERLHVDSERDGAGQKHRAGRQSDRHFLEQFIELLQYRVTLVVSDLVGLT